MKYGGERKEKRKNNLEKINDYYYNQYATCKPSAFTIT